MSDRRRLQVLQAIVQDYVATSEPVGSKALLDRHQLGVSAATVRNDMAALEDEGLIAAPHTSAGRVPTDAGYRVFVDQLSEIKPLSPPERRAIREFLAGAVDLDDVVERTVRLLAGLTQQVAVMQYPSLTRSAVRHVELVALGGSRVMIVLIVNTGRVEQRVVDVGRELTSPEGERLLVDLRGRLNALGAGRPFADVAAALPLLSGEFEAADRPVVDLVTTCLAEVVVEEREERVVVAGTSNLARFRGDFPMTIGPVLEALEEHVVLLNLINALSTDLRARALSTDPRTRALEGPEASSDGVLVRIGQEHEHSGLFSTSMVSTGYGAGSDLVAGLGVLGPTRMDYPTTMAAVRAVATYVSRTLG